MGIILRPADGQPAISLEELVERLRGKGLRFELDAVAAKRWIIEQIVLAYQPWIEREDFNPIVFDKLIAKYGRVTNVTIYHPELDADDPLGFEFTDGERIWFGECYPTDTDDLSRAVMQLAKIIGYQAHGE